MAEDNKPLILNDVTLMSPGNWNGWNYHVEELRKAFDSTQWDDKHVTSLFIDHPENPANAAASWIGRVINPKQLADGTITGDVEIWDQDIIFKLTKAKAGFGISPRVIGREDEENKSFLDFSFDNFSLVAKPAQSTAYLELAKSLKFTGAIRQLSKGESSENNPKPDESEDLSLHGSKKEKSNLKKLKGGKKQMSDEKKITETETPEESEESEESESSEQKSEDLSDADVLSIMSKDLDSFNAYAKEAKIANPTISLKELAKGFKISQERINFVEELSESEATVLLKKLLNKIGPNEQPVKVDTASQDLANKMVSLEKTIKELGKKPKVAAPKAVQNLANVESEAPMFGKPISEGVRELAQVLKNR